MTKEITEKKKVNPLIYLVGIPAGLLILVLAYNYWEEGKLYRACAKDTRYLWYDYKGNSNCDKILIRR
jgi:hypothetical protein